MIPRFANPHLLVETARHVSRAELYTEPDEGEVPSATTINGAGVNALASLESLLKRSLGDIQMDIPSSSEPKKKRRKTKVISGEESTAEKDILIPFRLLSSSKEPKLVSLLPPPPPTINPAFIPNRAREPPTEDTKAQAKLRSRRAIEVAVDGSDIFEESHKTQSMRPRETKQFESVRTSEPLPRSPIFLLERPAPGFKPPLVSIHLPEREMPSPHTLNIEKFQHPVLGISTPPLSDSPDTSRPRSTAFKRRLRKLKLNSQSQMKDTSHETKPHPTFFRPMREWGGKSPGYAYGYENSKAVWTEGGRWRPYKRDTMTKGTVVV